jgi:hypothetical protein
MGEKIFSLFWFIFTIHPAFRETKISVEQECFFYFPIHVVHFFVVSRELLSVTCDGGRDQNMTLRDVDEDNEIMIAILERAADTHTQKYEKLFSMA